jgi:hypothetical protein
VKLTTKRRPCCGHSIEVSYDGYCTVLTCECICRRFCEHLHVTVPSHAGLQGKPLYGWCRFCRLLVDDAHIRTLSPQRDPRMQIYWLAEDAASQDSTPAPDAERRAPAATQLTLFP